MKHMGILYDILRVIESDGYGIATEADDITKDVESEASGISDEDSDGDNVDNSGDISMNTDNLLGDDDSQQDSNDEDNDENEEENTDNEDELGDDIGDDNPDDPTSDDPNDIENQSEEENDPFSESRKNKLKKQYLYLFNVVDNSISLISTYVPNVTNDNTIQTLSSVKENLEQCKEAIHTIITTEFKDMEYHELLKKYVGLNRIYELCTKILETYFKKYGESSDKASK